MGQIGSPMLTSMWNPMRAVASRAMLADIARDLVTSVRKSLTVDWASREDVRAKLRSTIKRLLAKHGYPPDAEPEAVEKVLRQMETFAEEWSPDAHR